MPRFVAIGGTWSWSGTSAGQWYDPGSPWSRYAQSRGCVPILNTNGQPFVWSSDANGWQFWRWWFGRRPDYSDWLAGALHLFAWLVPPLSPEHRLRPSETHLVTHSHGLQVALIAAAMGLRINTLIDVCGPVRYDVLDAYGDAARANIGFMFSIRGGRRDRWRPRGGVGDSRLTFTQARHPLADNEHRLVDVDHSEVLTDPSRFHLWDAWLDIIKKRDGHD